jgi:hypothetical protein
MSQSNSAVNSTVGGKSGRGRGRGKGSVSNGISRSGRSKNKGGNTADNAFIFLNTRLSTQENKDPSYIEMGIAHTSDSVAINIVRGAVTDVFNLVGLSGFNNTLFDTARDNCLKNMLLKLDTTYQGRDVKISNIRFEAITIDPSLITMNAYGTFLERMAVIQVATT